MRICGIELKSNNTILTLVDMQGDDIVDYIDMKIKKIVLEDDESRAEVISYKNSIDTFLKENSVEKIVIKKRAKKGTFSGGPVTFKMEGLIQLNTICDVTLISGQAISSYERKNPVDFPKGLKKYQEQAYLAVIASLK